jgi:hypothetical protein
MTAQEAVGHQCDGHELEAQRKIASLEYCLALKDDTTKMLKEKLDAVCKALFEVTKGEHAEFCGIGRPPIGAVENCDCWKRYLKGITL